MRATLERKIANDRRRETATAIKLRIFQVDAFGDVRWSGEKEIDGIFAPGVPIKIKRALSGMPNDGEDRCYTSVLGLDKTRVVITRIEKVLFSDGTVWTSPFMDFRPRFGKLSNVPISLGSD